MPQARRTNVRRANVTACTRCRSRKQRCDQKVPACSNCERAGASCISNDADGRSVPRSYISSLEDRVAYYESLLISHGLLDANVLTSSGHSPASAIGVGTSVGLPVQHVEARDGDQSDDQSDDLINRIALDCLEAEPFSKSIVTPNGQSLLRSLLSDPITRLLPTNTRSIQRSLLDQLPYEAHALMPPKDAAKRLIDTYFEHCDFFSPILPCKNEFVCEIEALYDNPSPPSDHLLLRTKFRAMTVFGTAVLLLNRNDPSVPLSRSEGYFASATRLLSENASAICTGDVEHLCNLLLIVQHTCFSSNITAAWHFLGLATRLAVELGLHNERAAPARLKPEQVSHRRWLFWSTYAMERNLCVIFGRPFSIPDEAIEAPLPDEPESDPRRSMALHLAKGRCLESEAFTTLTQRGPSNGAILDKAVWRDSLRERFMAWRAWTPALEQSSALAPGDIFDGNFFNAMVLLYYPSSHFPSPSRDDTAFLARNAVGSIKCYRQAFLAGHLRFYWRTVHNLFRSGVALVYCLRASAADPFPSPGRSDMVECVNACSSVLWGMVERYPAGEVYRDLFENLASSVVIPEEEEPPVVSENIFNQLSAGLGRAELQPDTMSLLGQQSWDLQDFV